MRHCSVVGAGTFAGVLGLALLASPGAGDACCPAPRSGQEVVNADQTVLMIWDAAKETQHFIRQASFASRGDDFGFIVPSPSKPELTAADPAAFAQLAAVTVPEVIRRPAPRREGGGCGIGCGAASAPNFAGVGAAAAPDAVRVLEQKLVAGYQATVLEADSVAVLTNWLKANDFAFSPEVAAWAKPYVEQKWKFTALRVAPAAAGAATVATTTAKALRITFATKTPLFPYREPDPSAQAKSLAVRSRLLRVYFVAEARYTGTLGSAGAWSGRTAWAGPLTPEGRAKLLTTLKLPDATGPAAFHLTEFEDRWAYESAPADVAFAPSADQAPLKREPIVEYVQASRRPDAAGVAPGVLAFAVVGLWLARRRQ